MMKMDLRHGKVCYWALIFSVAAHSVTLAVFTGVKLSGRAGGEVSPPPVISLQMIERVVVTEPVAKPKPRVEPIVQPESKQPALVTDPQPPELVAADVSPESDPLQVTEAIVDLQPQPDEVEFFGQKSRVQRVCYVVDCSGSMYGRMYLVKDQLKRSILKLNSRQGFSVMFFMEGQTLLTSGGDTLAPATAGAKSVALELIESVRPSGSTDAGHALEAAMQLKGVSGKGPEVVYFLTDGFDLDPASSRIFVEKVNRLRSKHAPGAILHTIGFGSQPGDRQMLRHLAQNSGGAFIEVN